MIMPPICSTRRTLPLLGLALGLSFISAHGQAENSNWKSTGSAAIQLVSPDRVTAPEQVSPVFSELYTFPIDTDLNRDATDFWIVRNVQTLSIDDESLENGEGSIYFSNYASIQVGRDRQPSETGHIAWRGDNLHETSIPPEGTIGFIRTTRRPSELPTTPTIGHFTGAHGNIGWAIKFEGPRNALLELSGANYAPEVKFEDFVTMNVSNTTGLTIPPFSFLVPQATEELYWEFAVSNPTRAADGVFTTLVERSDLVFNSDLPGEDNPQDFWSRHYFLVLLDDQDSDRDGIPDFADLTQDLVAFPWYADHAGGNNWYYSYWLNDWVYSDRQISLYWDYTLRLGWTYVPPFSSKRNFWVYMHGTRVSPEAGLKMEWIYTNQSLYPDYYRASTNEWLRLDLQKGEAGTARFYNWNQNHNETVQF